MQRVLVGYATRAGSTAEVAGIIADELRARGIDVVVADLRNDPDPAGFDGFVLGSATSQADFAGRYAPEKVGLFKKLLFWILAKKPADHVDPPTIRAWARGLDLTRMSGTP